MMSAKALISERERFFEELRYNKTRFQDFLGSMAYHYRQPVARQVSIFLHAPSDGRAFAEKSLWLRLGTQISDNAEGVPVEASEGYGITELFDISQTVDAQQGKLASLLWSFDADKDAAAFERKGNETIEDAIVRTCMERAAELEGVNQELAGISTAYVVLSRLGLDAEDAVGLKFILADYHDVDAEKLVRGIKEASTAILDPVRKIVKEREKKEREEAFDAIFREGKRNHKEGHDAAGTHGGGEGDFRGDFSENGGQHDPVQPEEASAGGDGGIRPDVHGVQDGRNRKGRSTGEARGESLGDNRDPKGARGMGDDSEGVSPVLPTPTVVGDGRIGVGSNSFAAHTGEDAESDDENAGQRGSETGQREESQISGNRADNEPSTVSHSGIFDRGTKPVEETRETEEGKLDVAASSVSDEEIDFSKIDYSLDMSTTRGKRAVFQRNLAAIRVLKKLEKEERPANEEERKLLKSYSGFGGLSEAFDPSNEAWSAEYDALCHNLTSEEYSSARASVLDAYYTPPEIAEAIMEGLGHLGFHEGNILEPSCGTGRFFEAISKTARENSNLYGIELDSLSARIAKMAYPDAEIAQQGFESTRFADGSFDVAIGNVPFGDTVISSDPKYMGENLKIHDYFLLKMLDEVRAGGVVCAITTAGTMDKANPHVREMLAQKAALVTAIRLPSGTFHGTGTDVMTDLLVFRKHGGKEIEKSIEMDGIETELLASSNDWDTAQARSMLRDKNGQRLSEAYRINSYFLSHPDNRLGTFAERSTRYGKVLSIEPREGESLKDGILKVFHKLPENSIFKEDEKLSVPIQTKPRMGADMGFYVENGELSFVNVNGESNKTSFSDQARDRILSAVYLRDAGHAVLSAQEQNCTDEELYLLQQRLNKIYESHVKRFGRIAGDKALKRDFGIDPGYNFIRSFEIKDEKERFLSKADIFTQRTIRPELVPDQADSPEDALVISIQQKGKVDLEYMAELTGQSIRSIANELEYTHLFFDEKERMYIQADEFLTGNIQEKIDWQEAILREINERETEILVQHFYPEEQSDRNRDGYSRVPFEELPEARQNDVVFLLEVMERDFDFISYLVAPDNWEWEEKHATKAVQVLRYAVKLYGEQGEDPRLSYSRLRQALKDPKEKLNVSLLFDFAKQTFPILMDQELPLSEIEEKQLFLLFEASKKEMERSSKELHGEEIDALRARRDRATKNLEALKEVLPERLEIGDISVGLGTPWLNPEIVEAFVTDLLELPRYAKFANIKFCKHTCEWKIEKNSLNNRKTYGTSAESAYSAGGKTAYELLELCLNQKNAIIRVSSKDNPDKKVIDSELSTTAQMMQQKLKDAFKSWLLKNPKRVKEVTDYYNRHFNSTRHRVYDGSKLKFPGMSNSIKLKPHQKDAVAHSLFGGNTLFAHCVGAGKTFEMVTAIMESKRLGLSHKALMVVPNHLTGQTGEEFQRLYPKARILVARKQDFEKKNRQEFISRIATQNWDAVIMGDSSFEKVKLSKEREEAAYKRQVEELEEELYALREVYGGKDFSVRKIEALLRNKKEKLGNLLAENQKNKDATISFEELGIDKLVIDEAHNFKNLEISTRHSQVGGVGTTKHVQKTWDLYMKTQYINEITGGTGIIFATGTPVSNSLTELYTLQRYLAPQKLKDQGLERFDAWAGNYAQITADYELKPEGGDYQLKERFSSFDNLPELMGMFREFADVRTADMLSNTIEVPEAEVIVDTCKPTAEQRLKMKEIVKRADAIRKGNPLMIKKSDGSEVEDSFLLITNDGRKLSLDARLVDESLSDAASSKVNRCIKNTLEIFDGTTANRSTQVIFCDDSTSTGKGKGKFNIYDDIREKLLAAGVPKEEIAVVQETPDKDKQALFERVRAGEVRILLGSTATLGVGTNIQDKLIALHDLSVPWRPSDLEQRTGRIVRPGNENKHVKIFRYVTEGTFDAYLWQTIENKQKIVAQAMTSKSAVRSLSNVDAQALSYAEIKATATGDPYLKEKLTLENSLARIGIARADYESKQQAFRELIETKGPAEIKAYAKKIQVLQSDQAMLNENSISIANGEDIFRITINGKVYTDREKAGSLIREASQSGVAGASEFRAEYKGFKLKLKIDFETKLPCFTAYGKSSYDISLLGEDKSIIRRIEHLPMVVKERIEKATEEKKQIETNMESAKEILKKPFEHEKEEKRIKERLIELNNRMNQKEEQNGNDDELAVSVAR